MDALISQGSDSRIYSAYSMESGVDSAFVIKCCFCRKNGEVWRRCMREIEAGLMMRQCPSIVELLGYSVRMDSDDRAEIFLLFDRLECLGSIHPDVEETLEMCRDICGALESMRRRGLVHCDVKPGNIYRREGRWLLGDLGSVCLAGEVPSYASEAYCSPEAYSGEKCDIRSDIYSLGITCYRMLTGGKLPFCDTPCEETEDGKVFDAIKRRLGGEAIPPVEAAGERINLLLKRMCAFDRRKRFRRPSEIVKYLEKFI